MKCPFCGTDNPAGEMFCSNCGGYLDPSAANAPTIAATVPSVNTGASASMSGPPSNPGTVTVSGTSGTLAVNARLQNGRYVVDRILGQGGMGAAVLARDTRVANKLVVIKELISDNTDPQQRQDDVRNFEREVETLTSIDHPLVPTVTDSFQEGSRYYMVQEYAAGETLEHRIEHDKKPMPEREALEYTAQVLDILDYLSQMKPPLIHRDIKPANIIIGAKDKRARLVDFGIARADEAKKAAQKKQTSALGTPGYAPPEQYQGNADARSDLYGLAATLHHLVTNRDPRDYPPFNYPPARSLNPQVTADTDRLLQKALTLDINKRYQNAAEMKHDIDNILAHRFSASPDTSVYMRSSGPMTAPRQPVQGVAASAGGPASRPPARPQPQPAASAPTQQAYRSGYPQQRQQQQQAPAMSPPQPVKQKGNGNSFMLMSFILLVIVLVVIGGAFFVIPRLSGSPSTNTATPTTTTGNQGQTPGTTPPASSAQGIGTTTLPSGEVIGLSDGTFAFDTQRPGGATKQQASEKLKNGDSVSATSGWRAALSQDSNDAETLIYLENQRILDSNVPHITLVVGTMLTGGADAVAAGRDSLQGAYVAQKEFNTQKPNGMQMVVLVANAGSQDKYAAQVAQQIVEAAKKDKTIIGVMGWSFSSYTQSALNVLNKAQIPMISGTASSDSLSGASSYFFRVAPPNKQQGKVAADYAQKKLNAKNVAVFRDGFNPYSQSLGQTFIDEMPQGTTFEVQYTVGKPDSVTSAMDQTLAKNPDLIYFAGYPTDATALLEALAKDNNNVKVLGGDALSNSGYSDAALKARPGRLFYTAFAYPDEWGILAPNAQKPVFFTDYAKAFDPNNKHPNAYGYSRAQYNVMLSYDAMLTMASAAKNALAGGKTDLTGTDLQQALGAINGSKAIQGVSGYIALDPQSGDPVKKAVLILKIDDQGFTQMESLGDGQFLK